MEVERQDSSSVVEWSKEVVDSPRSCSEEVEGNLEEVGSFRSFLRSSSKEPFPFLPRRVKGRNVKKEQERRRLEVEECEEEDRCKQRESCNREEVVEVEHRRIPSAASAEDEVESWVVAVVEAYLPNADSP